MGTRNAMRRKGLIRPDESGQKWELTEEGIGEATVALGGSEGSSDGSAREAAKKIVRDAQVKGAGLSDNEIARKAIDDATTAHKAGEPYRIKGENGHNVVITKRSTSGYALLHTHDGGKPEMEHHGTLPQAVAAGLRHTGGIAPVKQKPLTKTHYISAHTDPETFARVTGLHHGAGFVSRDGKQAGIYPAARATQIRDALAAAKINADIVPAESHAEGQAKTRKK